MKSGTNKPQDLALADVIAAEVEEIRRKHPARGSYREQLRALIELLFFTYGERAGATRLVALLSHEGKSPSTSTAQSEIDAFWKRIRETAKVRLERADVPPFLLDMFGQMAASAWENSMAQAQATQAQADSTAETRIAAAVAAQALAESRVSQAEAAAAAANDRVERIEVERIALQTKLSAAQSELSTLEKAFAEHREQTQRSEQTWSREMEGLRETVRALQTGMERVERESRKLLVVGDDYKTAAMRDREAKTAAERALRDSDDIIQSLRSAVSRATNERGVLEGRASSAEAQAERLQQERDAALAQIAALQARQIET